MEEDYQKVFDYMLSFGLCSPEDRKYARELCEDWMNIYNETSKQDGKHYESDAYVRSLCYC